VGANRHVAVGGLFFAVLNYRRQMQDIRTRYKQYGPFPRSVVTPVAGVVAGLGVLGVVLVLLHL
jgi:hypothetical protein